MAAVVFDHKAVAGGKNAGMARADRGVVKNKLIVVTAADGYLFIGQPVGFKARVGKNNFNIILKPQLYP